MVVIEVLVIGVSWIFVFMMDIFCDVCWGWVMEGGGEDIYFGSVIVVV